MFDAEAVNDNELNSDVALPFLIEKDDANGQFVRLNKSCNKILKDHNYPDSVSKLLSEMLTITVLMGSSLKTDGIVTLQIQGDGPVSFIVCDFTNNGHIRGYANILPDRANEIPKEFTDINQLIGNGFLVISIENNLSPERYQGIVRLEGNSLSTAITKYFEQSVQREVSIQLVTKKLKNGRSKRESWHCGAIMIQKIPKSSKSLYVVKNHEDEFDSQIGDTSIEQWRRAKAFLDTVTEDELLNTKLSINDTLYKLFHEYGVMVFHANKLKAKCRCSRKKVNYVLEQMSNEELKDLVDSSGLITVKCQFCSKEEIFSSTELGLGG